MSDGMPPSEGEALDAWDAMGATTLHIRPADDIVAHDTSSFDACVCGPDVELRRTAKGDKWLVVHHSLDGRELCSVCRGAPGWTDCAACDGTGRKD